MVRQVGYVLPPLVVRDRVARGGANLLRDLLRPRPPEPDVGVLTAGCQGVPLGMEHDVLDRTAAALALTRVKTVGSGGADLSLVATHEIAADAAHQLTHAVPRLSGVTVHTDPATHPGAGHHEDLSHQRRHLPVSSVVTGEARIL